LKNLHGGEDVHFSQFSLQQGKFFVYDERDRNFLGLLQVPFGKAAFMPGRLIHTNEFLV
jgi:hypothetical protein